jgi:hypothetical protein
MLTGGVMTSIAMSAATFKNFVANKTAASGAFTANEDVRMAAQQDVMMHAVFCYGWWDNPRTLGDGYWICKNRCAIRLQAAPEPFKGKLLQVASFTLCGWQQQAAHSRAAQAWSPRVGVKPARLVYTAKCIDSSAVRCSQSNRGGLASASMQTVALPA